MVFKATLNNMTVLLVEDPEKTTDLSQVTANFITYQYNMLLDDASMFFLFCNYVDETFGIDRV
jgi:hypothetical protein